ncbi:hypothetical protein CesoFtcFv8_013454 [Champsocephalus esox]|uniref:Uncharacterized protein n=1 Tax=Champsocephalus esox TaxID=159716 RepID=A0AAN8BRH8_9TELE|nr:hypothetical protein CesoFtcFv8_013454 [Champsocephalus esox]
MLTNPRVQLVSPTMHWELSDTNWKTVERTFQEMSDCSISPHLPLRSKPGFSAEAQVPLSVLPEARAPAEAALRPLLES